MALPPVREEELGLKWDHCLADAIVKLGGGILIGSAVSLVFFRRKKWPLIIGGGFGLGQAYANCEKDLNQFVQSASRTDLK